MKDWEKPEIVILTSGVLFTIALFIAIFVKACETPCEIEEYNCIPALRCSYDTSLVCYPDKKCQRRCKQ